MYSRVCTVEYFQQSISSSVFLREYFQQSFSCGVNLGEYFQQSILIKIFLNVFEAKYFQYQIHYSISSRVFPIKYVLYSAFSGVFEVRYCQYIISSRAQCLICKTVFDSCESESDRKSVGFLASPGWTLCGIYRQGKGSIKGTGAVTIYW